MKLIIHDLDEKYNEIVLEKFKGGDEEIKIISDNGNIKHCIGCFGCWIKTPGRCIIDDGYNEMGALLGKTKEIIIMSECKYGTFSPFVRNILDRSIGYIHPDFTKRKGEIHHKERYSNRMKPKVYFYGNITKEEKVTAEKIVEANMLNFNGIEGETRFFEKWEDIINENRIN